MLASINVKITKGNGWYKELIGEIFTVIPRSHTSGNKDYIVKEDYDRGYNAEWRHIDKEDCDLVI